MYFGGFLLRNKKLLPLVTEPQIQKKFKNEVARLERRWKPKLGASPGPGLALAYVSQATKTIEKSESSSFAFWFNTPRARTIRFSFF